MMKPTLKIDVVSDIVCPWCYIGKRRLERAIDQLSDEFAFEVDYHPFELDSTIPDEGVDRKNYLVNKFGSEDQYEKLTNQTAGVAAAEGLVFNLDKQRISPNTRRSHALIQASKAQGKQLEITDALFEAYFTKGVDLSKKESLISIGVDLGMDRNELDLLLEDDQALVAVELAEKAMQGHGIQGVPFYIINNRYGISGAQSTDTFVEAFKEIAQAVSN